MKKLFITAAIATMFSLTAFADGGKKPSTEASEKNVTLAALNQFKSDFKSADNVLWTVTPSCQKVSFVDNNKDYTAFYSLSGDYLGVTQDVAYTTLAASVRTKIAKNYQGYKISDVIKYDTRNIEEPVVYFVAVKNDASEIVLKVTDDNNISYFKRVK
ncbi:hypothetical protein [Mucilaginibacter sp.]|uniref:hypothetical protein n=1 Tax=Mucilaginibacter sp. TaxID=1882438 RepID=UPI0026396773|nr:hypothetical protein [Mucilaginibacter sp.]MDB5031574.1 hypothetical protein [Mucilaginibacter sp.]